MLRFLLLSVDAHSNQPTIQPTCDSKINVWNAIFPHTNTTKNREIILNSNFCVGVFMLNCTCSFLPLYNHSHFVLCEARLNKKKRKRKIYDTILTGAFSATWCNIATAFCVQSARCFAFPSLQTKNFFVFRIILLPLNQHSWHSLEYRFYSNTLDRHVQSAIDE